MFHARNSFSKDTLAPSIGRIALFPVGGVLVPATLNSAGLSLAPGSRSLPEAVGLQHGLKIAARCSSELIPGAALGDLPATKDDNPVRPADG